MSKSPSIAKVLGVSSVFVAAALASLFTFSSLGCGGSSSDAMPPIPYSTDIPEPEAEKTLSPVSEPDVGVDDLERETTPIATTPEPDVNLSPEYYLFETLLQQYENDRIPEAGSPTETD